MNLAGFIGDLIVTPKWPPFLIFFVTNLCMMKCAHCFYWKNLNDASDEMSLSEIEKIADSTPRLSFLRLTGGEPFIRKDLADIIGLFYSKSRVRRIAITTNGFLVEQILKTTERVVSEFPDLSFEVGISIDNLKDKHDDLRATPGAFEKAIETFSRLAVLQGKYSNLGTGFIVTMTKENQDDIVDVFEYLKSLSPDGMGLNIVRGEPKSTCPDDIDIEKYDRVRNIMNEYNFRKNESRSFVEQMRRNKTIVSQDLIIKMIREPKEQIRCLAGQDIAVLYPDGNLAACEMLPESIGNLRDYGYNVQALWADDKRKKIIKFIKDTHCFCTHECFITASAVFSPAVMTGIAAKTLKERVLKKTV